MPLGSPSPLDRRVGALPQPPIAQYPTVPPPNMVTYAFVAFTVIPQGSSSPFRRVVGVPPPRATFITEPGLVGIVQ